jgi:hypothetical protein
MKTNRRKQRKNIKAARESLMEVLREIEKAALGEENPTRVKDLTDDNTTSKSKPRIPLSETTIETAQPLNRAVFRPRTYFL